MKNSKQNTFTILNNFILLGVFVVTLQSCNYFKKKFIGEDETPIARVNQMYLYPSDVAGITKGLSGEDSLKALKAFSNKWIREQLLLEKAKENIPDDDAAIIKKLEDYKEQLILYEYEKALIASKLDTSIKAPEFVKYYENFNANFPLEENVYHVQYIRLKEDAIDLKEIKKLILSSNKSEEEELKIEGYSKANANSFAYSNPLWYSADNLISFFSLKESELNSLQQSNKFREFNKEDGTLYFIRIVATRKRGEPMPLELAKSYISKILIEKRKMKLIDQAYERVFNDGISSKKAESFVQ